MPGYPGPRQSMPEACCLGMLCPCFRVIRHGHLSEALDATSGQFGHFESPSFKEACSVKQLPAPGWDFRPLGRWMKPQSRPHTTGEARRRIQTALAAAMLLSAARQLLDPASFTHMQAAGQLPLRMH